MDRFEDIKALYGIASAQMFLLNHLYTSLFAADPEARKRLPELLLDAAIFRQRQPSRNANEEVMVDIQAQMVLSLRVFFGEVESRVQQQETAESVKVDLCCHKVNKCHSMTLFPIGGETWAQALKKWSHTLGERRAKVLMEFLQMQ